MKIILLSLVLILIFSISAKSQSEDLCPLDSCVHLYYYPWETGDSTMSFSKNGCNIVMHYVKRAYNCESENYYEFQILYFTMDPMSACSLYSSSDLLYEGQFELLKHSKTKFGIDGLDYDVTIYKKACWYQYEDQGGYYLVRPCPGDNPCCRKKYTLHKYKQTLKQKITNVISYVDNTDFICPEPNPYLDQCSNKCSIGRSITDTSWFPQLLIKPTDIENDELLFNKNTIQYKNNELTIFLNNQTSKNSTVSIFNVLGELLYIKQINTIDEYSVVLPENLLVSGIYFVLVEIDNETSIKSKIVVY